MGDQDHDFFFSSIMFKNIDNQIPIAFDETTPSKTTTPTTKSPSSIIGKESYKDKKCDQSATNHLKQELLHEIKHYISCLQKHNKTGYMNEYIKAMQDQIASLKSEVMFLRGEVKKKNTFIEQLNNNNIINNNNNNIIIIVITLLIEIIITITRMMIIIFFIKLVIVLLISLTIIILVMFLTTLIMITIIIIMIIIIKKIMTIITKIVKFFLIINLHPLKTTIVML